MDPPDAAGYDLAFRPSTYWGPQTLLDHFGSRIKGELRRRAMSHDVDQGEGDERFLRQSLSEEDRSETSAVHPWLIGGEYLPDLYSNEVEIARVVMKSTTMDVISVRARRTKHRIVYRIVDEYEGQFQRYEVHPKTSTRSLTLRQLTSMLDSAVEGGLVGGGRQWNFDASGGDPEDYFDFETASSQFYPQLAAWYDKANAEWLAAIQKERSDEELACEEAAGAEALRVRTPLEVCFSSATWVNEGWSGAGGMHAAFQGGLRRRAAEHFAQTFQEKYGRLPEGLHKVSVTYGPPGTADIVTPIGDQKGRLEVEITFPAGGASNREETK